MDWKRVYCAECLTDLAPKNNVSGGERYLNKMDPSVQVECLIAFPFSAFPSFMVKAHSDHKEITQVVDYIMAKSVHQEHLSFATLAAARKNKSIPWVYQVHTFYWVIFRCDLINDEILTMLLKAGLVDPGKHQVEIIRRYRNLWKNIEVPPAPQVLYQYTESHRLARQNTLS